MGEIKEDQLSTHTEKSEIYYTVPRRARPKFGNQGWCVVESAGYHDVLKR